MEAGHLSWQQLFSTIYEAAASLRLNLQPAQVITLASVAQAESGAHVEAVGSGSAHSLGLFQINPEAHPQYNTQQLNSNALYNTIAALQVSNGATDFHPWTTANNGAAESFVSEAAQSFAQTFPGLVAQNAGLPPQAVAAVSSGQATLASYNVTTVGWVQDTEKTVLGILHWPENEAKKLIHGAVQGTEHTAESALGLTGFEYMLERDFLSVGEIVLGTVIFIVGVNFLARGSLGTQAKQALSAANSGKGSGTPEVEGGASEGSEAAETAEIAEVGAA